MGGAREEGRRGLGFRPPPLIPSFLPPADVQKESKENQWLGVSVRSQGPGGKIVVSTTSVTYARVCVGVHVCVQMHDVLTEHRLGICVMV